MYYQFYKDENTYGKRCCCYWYLSPSKANITSITVIYIAIGIRQAFTVISIPLIAIITITISTINFTIYQTVAHFISLLILLSRPLNQLNREYRQKYFKRLLRRGSIFGEAA